MSTKLELTWPGKDEPFMLEPRILIEDKNLSNIKNDIHTENILIHGDNLLALKALERKFAGLVKCVYIDPPYNTGAAFEHYDDNFEHSTWLNLMKPRLELLKTLLADDGSIWISIDDDEQAYLKVLCDEIFGRNNFICNIVWQKKYGASNDSKWISDTHDYIMVYAKNKNIWHPNLLSRNEEQMKDYKNPDNDPRGLWRASDLSARTYSASCDYEIIGPTGKSFLPPPTRAWTISRESFKKLCDDNKIWWGKNRDARPMRKKFLYEVKQGITPETWWSRDFADDNKVAKYESKDLFEGHSFATPKPERLIERVLTLATNPGDLVLDSFLGSGTTAAVALKMNRKFIGIEIGEHAYTHCKKRLDKVIAGEDLGGVTKSMGWTGGGGYRFYELAPSLLNHDEFNEPVINENYTEEMLARAAALHEGYTYEPDEKLFWKQSKGSEKSFLYVTSQHVSSKFLASIHDTMGENEFLIIACRTYDKGAERAYKNIKVKKIPQVILDNCEYDRENYNLNIINPPVSEDFEEEEEF